MTDFSIARLLKYGVSVLRKVPESYRYAYEAGLPRILQLLLAGVSWFRWSEAT
jgi:hypothetical protein